MSISRSYAYFVFSICAILFASPFGCGGSGGGTASSDLSTIVPIASEGCGDAELDPGEGCDDGNWENSDGCNARCGLEVGESFCSNGVKENDECCDDGNLINGDGCNSVCTLEAFNRSPSAPVLPADPADGVTWAPTRLYLSWLPSTDPDIDDVIVYDVFFAEGNGIPSNALPYRSSVSETEFIIQASTDNRSKYFPDRVLPIHLQPLRTYTWMICARDNQGATACSPTRAFNTDNCVQGWWRFDENPSGSNCPGGNGGETVCDYSGNNNHGVPQGNPAWLDPASDILGQALEFDGSNDYVSVQNAGSLNPDSITVIAQIKTAGKFSEQEILDKRQGGAAGPAGFDLRIQGSSFPLDVLWIVTESSGPEHILEAPFKIADSTKYNLIGTFELSSGNSNLFINSAHVGMQGFGVLDRSSKSTSNLILGDTPVWSNPSQFVFKGLMEEIVILNRVQSAEEAKNNSQAMEWF